LKVGLNRSPTDPRARVSDALAVAMMYDADLFRASLEIATVQALPQEVMRRPGVVDRIMKFASTHEVVVPPAPSRQQLLRMLYSERRERFRSASRAEHTKLPCGLQ
jgi:hypothetical protein